MTPEQLQDAEARVDAAAGMVTALESYIRESFALLNNVDDLIAEALGTAPGCGSWWKSHVPHTEEMAVHLQTLRAQERLAVSALMKLRKEAK